MKKISIIAILLLMVSLFFQCKKEDEQAPIKDFTLAKTALSLAKETQERISITSGNGNYTISQLENGKLIAEVSLVNNNTELLVKSIAEGSTSVEITDVLSKKSVKLEILVLSKVTAQDYELSEDKKTLIKWKGTNTKVLDMNAINELKGVTTIGTELFSGNEIIESVVLPLGLSSIGEQAFMDCTNLKKITIPETVTKIERGAFASCKSLEKIDLPKGITEIPGTMLYECTSLTELILPEGIKTIGYNAFSQIPIKEIVFPNSVTQFDTAVVEWCDKLEKIVFKSLTPPVIQYDSLKRKVEEPPLKIYVPKGKKQAYIDSSEEWKELESLIEESK
nr:leucine-rich repeat domain-containing protein [uncultured Capnocytophaga sp.]